MRNVLILLVFSIAALLIHGYQYAVSDQEIFIPFILKWQDHSLFRDDLLFNQNSAKVSLFYPIYGTLSKFLEIELLFFISYLLFQFFLFFAIHRLASILLNNKKTAYLSLLPFLLPKFIGGTATLTFDTFFGYRSIGVIFLILYLAHTLEKKYLKAMLFAIVGVIIHPLSIIPSILFLPSVILAQYHFKKLRIIQIAIVSLTFLLSAAILIPKNDIWLSIIKLRDDYLFISTWKIRALAATFLYVSLIFLFMNKLSKEKRKIVLLFVTISLALFLINFLVLEIFKIPQIAQFQLVRSITPLAYIGLVLSPLFLMGKNFYLKITGFASFLMLSINQFELFLLAFFLFTVIYLREKSDQTIAISKLAIMITVAIIMIISFMNVYKTSNLKEKVQFPKQTNDWIDLQIWAKENTAKNSTFLVPSQNSGFRIFSQRPIIADIKDGAVVMYSPIYAQKWYSIVQDLESYENFTELNFKILKNKYLFSYFISNNKILNFEKIYENNSFVIYKI